MIIEISNNELILFIIGIIVVIFIYKKYFSAESFASVNWDDKTYYNNELNEYPVIPSIVNCDIKKVKTPKEIQRVTQINNPVQNIKNTKAPENINQTGANLDEVFKEERNLMQPILDMRDMIRPESSILDTKEMVRPETIRREQDYEQDYRQDPRQDYEQDYRKDSRQDYRQDYRQDSRQECKQDYKQDYRQEYEQEYNQEQDYRQEEDHEHEPIITELNENAIPKIDYKIKHTKRRQQEPIRDEDSENNNMTYAIILSAVLLYVLNVE